MIKNRPDDTKTKNHDEIFGEVTVLVEIT